MHISRNKRVGATAVAVAAIPVTAFSLLPSNAATGAADQTFKLVERPGTFRFVDLPPMQGSPDSPPSVGDEFIFTSPLYRAGKHVGRVHAVCTVTKRTKNMDRIPSSCVGTFVLRGGSIEVQVGGALNDSHLEIAITGGTGRYAGARGTITSRTVGRRSIDTVHLLS